MQNFNVKKGSAKKKALRVTAFGKDISRNESE